MKLLAVDCSTEACSVAVYHNTSSTQPGAGQTVIESFELAAREHTQRLLPMVQRLLADAEISLADLDGIAFARGPGSFTGLRIALGAVQGLAFGADLPVLPVSTLAALAQTAVEMELPELTEESTLVVALDARMDEVYWSRYSISGGLVVAEDDEHLSSPEACAVAPHASGSPVLAVGNGFDYIDRMLVSSPSVTVDSTLLPRAGAVGRLGDKAFQLGEAVSADQAVPLYLRDQVAWQKTSPGGVA